MKRIKLFEEFDIKNDYMYGKDMLIINNVMEYLEVDTMIMDEESEPESIYNIDILEFFKEIFLNKTVIFNKFKSDYKIKGEVEDVDFFAYKDLYIKLKIKIDRESSWWTDNPTSTKNDWYILSNNSIIGIYDYDADNKPLHKEVKMKKDAKRYNL